MAARAQTRPVTFMVDPSMYGPMYATPREVYGNLDRVVRSDLYYHYSTPICAQRWLDVCDDPAYGHQALLDRLETTMAEVAEALRDDSGWTPRLAMCSLGPGDGSIDERMLRGLDGTFELASYTGLDSSLELLRRSVHRMTHITGLPEDMPVHAICGDFTGLESVALPERAPDTVRLFTLTGFTLGNYPEDDLLAGIEGLMAEGDYLLLDARLHSLGPLPDDLESTPAALGGTHNGYDADTVRRFVLGPVEVATRAPVEDIPVSFELVRSITAVPNALSLVIYCEGLDTKMRLTGQRVRRDRLDLAVTTSYHMPDLFGWLEGAGLKTVWKGSAGDVAFFLLKR
ncbi:MAG: L-histidine N(alpha)-methyltransferase [Gemmatimonadetes bacterium]|nr:L-histidine N(alpha)-methyltransferase [Gemmatimonadota bacterium]